MKFYLLYPSSIPQLANCYSIYEADSYSQAARIARITRGYKWAMLLQEGNAAHSESIELLLQNKTKQQIELTDIDGKKICAETIRQIIKTT